MKKLMIAVSAVAVLAAGLVLLLWRDGESSGGEGQKLPPKKSAPREAGVEDEKERSRYIVGAMKILTDKDSLDTMIMQLDDCDDLVSLQALVDVIASQSKVAAEVAREHYEFTTSEKYVDFDTANDWISKNYVSDDGED